MSAAETGTEVLMVDVGAVRMAIPVGVVVGVDMDEPSVEVDTHAVLAQPGGDEDRRRIRVRGRQPFDLIVRSTLRVRQVDAADLQPLPAFLGGMRDRLGLVGLVRFEDAFALYMDPSVLEPEP